MEYGAILGLLFRKSLKIVRNNNSHNYLIINISIFYILSNGNHKRSLLGTSKRRVRASELFFLRLFGDITRGFICCKYFKNVRFFVFFVYVCNLSTIVRNFF